VSSYFKFLRRVRIHGRECGAVARALPHKIAAHPLSAVDKKVLFTTNERKEMSKPTFFKRIALTAIAALGFGMLSVTPSQAVITSHTLSIDAASDAITLGDSATAVLTHSFVNLGSVFDSVTIIASCTSSNCSTAGTIILSIADSYTSVANDATAANSPDYNWGMVPSKADSATPAGWSTDNSYPNWIDTTEITSSVRDSISVSYESATKSVGTSLQLKTYNPTAAGTYTFVVYTLASNDGATPVAATPTVTWTVTVTAPSRTATADSTVTLRNGDAVRTAGGSAAYFAGTAEGADSQTVQTYSTSTTSTTPGFSLMVKQKNGTSTNTAAESYTVQVSGEAWVTAGTTNVGSTKGAAAAAETRPTSATGVKWLQMATPVADSATAVRVWSTGTAGTATLTVTTASGLVIGTKTVTFHGLATTLTVSRDIKKVLQAGTGDAISSVFNVTVTDAGGRSVLGRTIEIVSSNLNAISTGSCTDAVGAVTDGVHVCSVTGVALSTSGAAATLTTRMVDPAGDGTTYLSTTYAVTMGGAVSTLKLTADKATYEPGEAMVLTATAKDASGNTPYDGQDGPTLRANKQLGGTAAGTTITMNAYYDGVSTSQTRSTPVRTFTSAQTLFAPAASGKFTISGLDGQTTPASVSLTATVGDDAATAAATAASDAAAEAIDAANAATDAANLAAEAADAATVAAEEARDAADAATAAVEALATEVATLMAALKAQVTTLANTVAKIAKKVKA